MNFAIADGAAGVNNASALRTMRGADPLLTLPPGHILLRVAGIPLQPSPGGGALNFNAVNASIVEAVLMGAAYFDGRLSGAAMAAPVLTVMVRPAKLDAIMSQLYAEPAGIGLDRHRLYESLSDAAADVCAAAARLNPAALHPAYVITPADLLDLEPVSQRAGRKLTDLCLGPNALTFGDLVGGEAGFAAHASFLYYCGWGRSLAASRDADGSALKRMLSLVEGMAIRAGCLAQGSTFSGTAFTAWMDATALPAGLHLLRESGNGAARREQLILDRQAICFGNEEQRERLVVGLLGYSPLKERVPNLLKVIGRGGPEADIRSCVQRLAQHLLGKSATAVVKVSVLESLEAELKPLMHALSSPATAVIRMDERVSLIAKAKADASGTGISTTAGDERSEGGNSLVVSKIKVDVYADALAEAFGTEAWSSLNQRIAAELERAPIPRLQLFGILMQAPFVGVRRAAMGIHDTSSAPLLRASPALTRAVMELKDWGALVANLLVCDLGSMKVTDPNLQRFRLEERVVRTLRRGSFDELDWVADILLPVMRIQTPGLTVHEFPKGLRDARAVVLLYPLLRRLSIALGLPVEPSTPHPGLGAYESGHTTAVSLCSLVATISAEALDIESHPSPFVEDDFVQLARFETTAWAEAAELFHQEVVLGTCNPVGKPQPSLLPDGAAALGVLAVMRDNKARRRQEAYLHATSYELLSDFRDGRFGDRYATKISRGESSRSKARDRSRSPSVDHASRSDEAPSRSRRASGENPCRHSPDRSRFWFSSQDTGKRVSPVYDYKTLEKIGGKKRSEVCYPFLLSSKPAHRRMSICEHPDEPGHRTFTSAAHVPPTADFLDQVHRHFQTPVVARPNATGGTSGPAKKGISPGKPRHLVDPRSPHPADARRSHGSDGASRSRSASPGVKSASSRSASPLGHQRRGKSYSGERASRSTSPAFENPLLEKERTGHSPRAGTPPIPRSPSPSPKPAAADASMVDVPRHSASSRAKKQRTLGARRVVWGAAAVAAPASANAMEAFKEAPWAARGVGSLVDVSAPCNAAVRTLLFLVNMADPDEANFLLPAWQPSLVIGSVSPLDSPRVAAVAEARRLLESLPFSCQGHHALCLPVFESIPAADDVMAVVDRVVVAPFPSGARVVSKLLGQASAAGWKWTKLSAVACVMVYALAATVAARLSSFSPSVPTKLLRVLNTVSSRVRTGARRVRAVKSLRGDAEEARRPGVISGDEVSKSWREAIVKMRASDEALRSALLAVPETCQGAEELHAFADVIRPVDLTEMPPAILASGAPPDYSSHQLRLVPFSTRVAPPRTAPLGRPKQVRMPPSEFKPRSIRDLITPKWMRRVEQWYHDLGEWLIRLSEVADAPDSPEAEAVRRARPQTLVVPRSGFAADAVDVVWDLTGETPVPLDFDAPFSTHLNLQLVERWRREWPDYPDREIFSHLLGGVQFKVDLPYQLVLQPHLASLSYGFVNVHKELIRLVEKGYFTITSHPPFVPWRTLPSGSVERKQEPGRPRRTEDGSAPRRGYHGAEFMVDADGVRTLSINLAASVPADDLRRGTHNVFYDAWERRLAGRYSPKPHRRHGRRPETEFRQAALLLFSGDGEGEGSLASQLLQCGVDVVEVDIIIGADQHDMARDEVQQRVLQLIRSAEVSFVFAAPPCESGSVATADSRPSLRSPGEPWGVQPVPKRWAAYLEKHNRLIAATADCLMAADEAGIPWMIENPALRCDPNLQGYWPRFENWGTLWHCFAALGIAPQHRLPHNVAPKLAGEVHETLVAACAFGAPHQKMTMFWSSGGCAQIRRLLEGHLCHHSDHPKHAHGIDELGRSLARAAAKYPPEMAGQLARGVATVVAAAPGSSESSPVGAPAQPDRRCGRCKHKLVQCDRCHQWCCETTGCFYVKCVCDLPEYPELQEAEVSSGQRTPQRAPGPGWAPRGQRVTCSDMPAPPASRSGSAVVDVNITLESSTPMLANPFLMGTSGKVESMRQLAAATYASFLAQRTVEAEKCSNGLRVAQKLNRLTGEMVLREVERIISRQPPGARFHLVCRKSCTGKACHGRELCRLFDEVIQATQPTQFPKELKPTVPEILIDLAVLMYLSHHTGIPVVQIVSDVKDFFNQHGLAPSEKPKVGLVTLDPRAIVEYAKQLRAMCPELRSVLAHVLGYGLTPASNVCQRTAHLLTFIWLARMRIEARSIVAALAIQYPFIAGWLEDRRKHFHKTALRGYAEVSACQARLWTVSMYTDDGHHALLGVQLAVRGLQVWRDITGSLKLQMAIIQKHGLGQQVTVQGVVLNTGLGTAYVPTDKLRRALDTLERALHGVISVAEYRSFVGLLQSLMFIAGMSRSSMYGLYAPLQGALATDPEELVKVTPWMREQLERWKRRLQSSAGSSFWNALPHLRGGGNDVLDEAPAVFFVRSDASKEGVGMAGLGGALGGAYWRYPERGPLDSRYLALPIAALEFIAYVGSVAAFVDMIPEDAVLVSEVDALATADALTTEAARSPLMQAIHLHLLHMPEFARIAQRHAVAHIYGEANVVADAVSRDLGDVLQSLAGQLNLRLQFVQPPACVPLLLEKVLGVAELAATSLGMHNPTMSGTPFAHANNGGTPWIGRVEREEHGAQEEHGARRREGEGEGSPVCRWKVGIEVCGDCDVEVCGGCDGGAKPIGKGCRSEHRLRACGVKARQASGGSDVESGCAAPDHLREADGQRAGENPEVEGDAAERMTRVADVEEPDPGETGGQERCDCVAGLCKNRAVGGRRSTGGFAFCANCRVDDKGVSCSCDCGACRPEASMKCGPEIMGRVLCKCPAGMCIEEADRFDPEIQRFVCESCAISTAEGVVCTCSCFGCEPLEKVEHDERAWCNCAKVFACANRVGSEGDERCFECSAGCSSEQRCSCDCVGCLAEARMERDRDGRSRSEGGRGGAEAGDEDEDGRATSGSASEHDKGSSATGCRGSSDGGLREAAVEEPVAAWRSERIRSLVWRGQNDWCERPEVASALPRVGEASPPLRAEGPHKTSGRVRCPPPPPPRRYGQHGLGEAASRGEAPVVAEMPECRCRVRLVKCLECASLRCGTTGCNFITCSCDVEKVGSDWRNDQRWPDTDGAASPRSEGMAGRKRVVVVKSSPRANKASRSPGPAADGSAAEAVAEMLEADASALALNPARVELRDLCRALYDTSTAQPERTSRAQASAWDHWVEWCVHNQTSPWRLITPVTEAERQREAVLMAGFLRFCHQRQSERPRAGRPAALVASATKALAHVRKVHKEKGFPMPDSALVLAQSKRLQLEYKSAHGIEAMQPQRKEPFTRKLVMDTLLLAPDGIDLGNGLTLRWESRFGRSFAGMVTTLMQTGFRKGEVTTQGRADTCPAQCLSRGAVAWYLRGQFFPGEKAPVELLARPQRGDYVVLTPGPSKSDQLGLVWGGTPIWIPFEDNEPLCAFPALARIEMHDACTNRRETALFTYDDGTPLVAGHMDRVLQSMLLRDLPAKTARLYSWHSARIFLATALRASGASVDETQALCRWQTPASLRIYARMNRERYGALVSGALKVEISSARACALADAMPFLKVGGSKPGFEDLWSEDGEAEALACDPMELESRAREAAVGQNRGAEGSPKRRRTEPDEARRSLQRGGRAKEAAGKVAGARRASNAPGDGERATGRLRAETTEKSKKSGPPLAEATDTSGRRGRPIRCHAAAQAPVQVSEDSARIQETTAEGRYGRVPYFPDDMADYKTFFERPSTRRPPNRERKEE